MREVNRPTALGETVTGSLIGIAHQKVYRFAHRAVVRSV
jgi:hypothetical protein